MGNYRGRDFARRHRLTGAEGRRFDDLCDQITELYRQAKVLSKERNRLVQMANSRETYVRKKANDQRA